MVVWTRMVEVGGNFWRNSQQDLIELREMKAGERGKSGKLSQEGVRQPGSGSI